jgi:hypothetical protein
MTCALLIFLALPGGLSPASAQEAAQPAAPEVEQQRQDEDPRVLEEYQRRQAQQRQNDELMIYGAYVVGAVVIGGLAWLWMARSKRSAEQAREAIPDSPAESAIG